MLISVLSTAEENDLLLTFPDFRIQQSILFLNIHIYDFLCEF